MPFSRGYSSIIEDIVSETVGSSLNNAAPRVSAEMKQRAGEIEGKTNGNHQQEQS